MIDKNGIDRSIWTKVDAGKWAFSEYETESLVIENIDGTFKAYYLKKKIAHKKADPKQ